MQETDANYQLFDEVAHDFLEGMLPYFPLIAGRPLRG
jgi:hypothetical protein